MNLYRPLLSSKSVIFLVPLKQKEWILSFTTPAEYHQENIQKLQTQFFFRDPLGWRPATPQYRKLCCRSFWDSKCNYLRNTWKHWFQKYLEETSHASGGIPEGTIWGILEEIFEISESQMEFLKYPSKNSRKNTTRKFWNELL